MLLLQENMNLFFNFFTYGFGLLILLPIVIYSISRNRRKKEEGKIDELRKKYSKRLNHMIENDILTKPVKKRNKCAIEQTLKMFFYNQKNNLSLINLDTITVSFYSYKGGVGCTLALQYLSNFMKTDGENICIIDFNLEAPGASFKIKEDEDENEGVIDYLGKGEKFSNSNLYLNETKIIGIDFLRAGKNVLSKAYFNTAFSLIANNFSGKEKGKGAISDLVQSIKYSQEYKYIFIDSRAGITPLSMLSTIGLPDIVLLFMVPNRESIIGTRSLFEMTIELAIGLREVPPVIIPILSRIPTPNTLSKSIKQWDMVDWVVNKFNDTNYHKKLEILKREDLLLIRSDEDVERNEDELLDYIKKLNLENNNDLEKHPEKRIIDDEYNIIMKKLLDRIENCDSSKEEEVIKINLLYRKESEKAELSVKFEKINPITDVYNNISTEDLETRTDIETRYMLTGKRFEFASYPEKGRTFISDCGKTIPLMDIIKDANLLDDIVLVMKRLDIEMEQKPKDNESYPKLSKDKRHYQELRIEIKDDKRKKEYEYNLFMCVLYIDRILARLHNKSLPYLSEQDEEKGKNGLENYYPGKLSLDKIGSEEYFGIEFSYKIYKESQRVFYLSDCGRAYDIFDGKIPMTRNYYGKGFKLHRILFPVDNSDVNPLIKHEQDNPEILYEMKSYSKEKEIAQKMFEYVTFLRVLKLFSNKCPDGYDPKLIET